ncbi:hypothetical protein B0H14DRAFT_2585338 [Mycena olivaceomarginata]|nr:hypothetical protein B0H14DRAFT_2585338 [Mycena olivaceomarginata]
MSASDKNHSSWLGHQTICNTPTSVKTTPVFGLRDLTPDSNATHANDWRAPASSQPQKLGLPGFDSTTPITTRKQMLAQKHRQDGATTIIKPPLTTLGAESACAQSATYGTVHMLPTTGPPSTWYMHSTPFVNASTTFIASAYGTIDPLLAVHAVGADSHAPDNAIGPIAPPCTAPPIPPSTSLLPPSSMLKSVVVTRDAECEPPPLLPLFSSAIKIIHNIVWLPFQYPDGQILLNPSAWDNVLLHLQHDKLVFLAAITAMIQLKPNLGPHFEGGIVDFVYALLEFVNRDQS